MVVDTTMPNSIKAEAFHKSLQEHDLRHSCRQGPKGETANTLVQAPLLPPNRGDFFHQLNRAAVAGEG